MVNTVKLSSVAVALSIMALMAMVVSAAPSGAQSGTNGFHNGYNYKARLYNGWYSPNVSLVMKWSKDWTPMADQPVGAWVTNHFTWYTNDTSQGWYGYDNAVAANSPNATYKVEEFLKIQKVADNLTAWANYQSQGAYDAGWGDYADGVPKYVVFQDNVMISGSGETSIVTAHPNGLGHPILGPASS